MNLLGEAYRPFIALGPTALHRGGELALPMTMPVLDDQFVKVSKHTITTYRQFYDWIQANKDAAVSAYRKHMALDLVEESERTAEARATLSATESIDAGLLPPLPPLEVSDLAKVDPLAAEYDARLQELVLSDRNVHRGRYLRFVRTTRDVWYALRDSVGPDRTACITTRVGDTIFRCHELEDGEGLHSFLTWYFDGELWALKIYEHSMAFENDLNLTQADFDED